MSGRLRWVAGLLKVYAGPVIIVHDIGDASTGPELNDLVAGFPACTMVEGHFGSPGLARMAGFEKVTTRFVAFMDSDDDTFGGLGAIELARNLSETGDDVCAGSFQVNDLMRGTERIYHVADTFEDSLRGHPGIWRFVFRTDFLRASSLNFTKIKMGEDLLFLLDAYLAGANYRSMPILVYGYNLGVPGQATSSQDARQDLFVLLRSLEDRFIGMKKVHRDLISYLWLKTFFSAAKNLPEFRIRIKLIRYLLHCLFAYPKLVFIGLAQIRTVIQNAGRLENSTKGFGP